MSHDHLFLQYFSYITSGNKLTCRKPETRFLYRFHVFITTQHATLTGTRFLAICLPPNSSYYYAVMLYIVHCNCKLQDYIFFSHFLTTHSIPFIHLLCKMVLIVYHSGTYDTHVMAVNKYYSFAIVMYFGVPSSLKQK